MKPLRSALVAQVAGLVLLPAWSVAPLAAQAGKAAPRAAAGQAQKQAVQVQAQREERKAQQQAARKQAAANNPVLRPGDVALQRFVNMTPEERQAAIAKLPPQQQTQILQRLQTYENMTPQAKDRLQSQLDLLRSLPQQRQNQVRASLRDINQLPQERRQAVRRELARMGNMTEDQRAARINSDEFRNAFAPEEQTMIGNISQVLPPKN